jgi:hypothetical protein
VRFKFNRKEVRSVGAPHVVQPSTLDAPFLDLAATTFSKSGHNERKLASRGLVLKHVALFDFVK